MYVLGRTYVLARGLLVLVGLLQLVVPLFDQMFKLELQKLLCNGPQIPRSLGNKHKTYTPSFMTMYYEEHINSPAGCGSWLGCYSFWSCYLTSPKKGSTQIKDPTNGSSIPTKTKTKTVLPSLCVLPNAYYERMEPNHYVCWLNIRLVLAITLKMLLSQRWMQSNNDPNQQQYHPTNQDPHHITKFTCSS